MGCQVKSLAASIALLLGWLVFLAPFVVDCRTGPYDIQEMCERLVRPNYANSDDATPSHFQRSER